MFSEHSHRKILVIIAIALMVIAVEGALLITGIVSIEVDTTMQTPAGATPNRPVVFCGLPWSPDGSAETSKRLVAILSEPR